MNFDVLKDVGCGAAGEEPKVGVTFADDVEVRGVAGLGQHRQGVAADWEDPACFDLVFDIETEDLLHPRDAASVNHGLAVVLAGGLEIIELHHAGGDRGESRRCEFGFDRGV